MPIPLIVAGGIAAAAAASKFGGGMMTDSKKTKATNNANNAVLDAAKQFNLSTEGINYNVTPDMVNQYMSPDVAFRQNAATQGLAQVYGNSGALKSSAAQSNIANANAGIAAQAWNDAFGRASGILGQNNNLELMRAQNMQDAQQGIAKNSLSNAMNQKSLLDHLSNGLGFGTNVFGSIYGAGGSGGGTQ